MRLTLEESLTLAEDQATTLLKTIHGHEEELEMVKARNRSLESALRSANELIQEGSIIHQHQRLRNQELKRDLEKAGEEFTKYVERQTEVTEALTTMCDQRAVKLEAMAVENQELKRDLEKAGEELTKYVARQTEVTEALTTLCDQRAFKLKGMALENRRLLVRVEEADRKIKELMSREMVREYQINELQVEREMKEELLAECTCGIVLASSKAEQGENEATS